MIYPPIKNYYQLKDLQIIYYSEIGLKSRFGYKNQYQLRMIYVVNLDAVLCHVFMQKKELIVVYDNFYKNISAKFFR